MNKFYSLNNGSAYPECFKILAYYKTYEDAKEGYKTVVKENEWDEEEAKEMEQICIKEEFFNEEKNNERD